MLELIAVLWMQEVETAIDPSDIPVGLEAECQWTGQVEDGVARGVDLVCPQQAPEYELLQRRVDWFLGFLPDDIATRSAVFSSLPTFVWTGDDWDLSQPHRRIYRGAPARYDRPFTSRMRTSVCYGRIIFDDDGEVDDQDWECVHHRRNGEASMRNIGIHRMARFEFENDSMILPLRMSSHCTEERFHMAFDGVHNTQELEAAFPEDEKPRCPAVEEEFE